MSVLDYFLIYAGMMIATPMIAWVLWFIGMLMYSFILGEELAPGDLNLYSSDGIGIFETGEFWFGAVFLWPIGLFCILMIFMCFTIVCLFKGFVRLCEHYFKPVEGKHSTFDFPRLTAALNRMNSKNKSKDND